jgi:hypothetical protein
MGIILDYPGGLCVITRPFRRGRKGRVREDHVAAEAEVGTM